MSALLLLLVCLALGVGIARVGRAPHGLAHHLNWWVLNIALPALVMALVPHIRFDAQMWFLVVTQWLVFAGAWWLFASLGPRLGWSRARTGGVILVAGLGNTSFVGYPLVEALRGQDGLALAVVADQVGCFPVLAIGGVAITAVFANQQLRPSEVARRILLFPAFVALLVGVTVGQLGGWPHALEAVLQRLGASLTPLALVSVGLQFRFHLGRQQLSAWGLGLGWKLLVAPLICTGLGLVAGVHGLAFVVGVLQAAMAPMISAAILADQHDLDPPLANAILGAGIVLCLISVPLANALLPAAV